MDDFLEWILQFDSVVSSHAGVQPEHCSENHRPGFAPGVDAFYASESGATLALFVTLPLLFCAIQPRDGDVQIASLPGPAAPETANSPEEKAPRTLARKVEEAWILNVIFVVAGIAALGLVWRQNGFSLDLNSVIFLFILAGLLLHWRPIAYVKAINNAA
jgi:short subunit fatty acids transporter